MACVSTFEALSDLMYRNTSCNWKVIPGPSDRLIPSSVAAACSSKSKARQISLRRDIPQALLIRDPNGEWMTSWSPPASSKKRSATMRFFVGTVPSTLTPSAM